MNALCTERDLVFPLSNARVSLLGDLVQTGITVPSVKGSPGGVARVIQERASGSRPVHYIEVT